MVYKPNIPVPSDPPIQSQPQITTNFGELDSQFGTEHTAFSAVANNGKHKYVTLPQNPTIPAGLPAGNDVILSQQVAFGTNYLRLNTSSSFSFVPLVKNIFKPLNVGSGVTATIVDFSTLGINHVSGTLHVFMLGHPERCIFCTFVYIAPTLSIPGIHPAWNGQLNSKTVSGPLNNLDGNASLLELTTGAAINDTIVTVITYTPV